MRIKNSILNMLSEFFPQLILMIIGFVKIKLFILVLGSEINGFNATLTEIMSYLMLVEGGFGISMIQALYKPLAEKDQDGIKRLYLGSEKILRIIGLVILGLSLVIAFFLPHLTSGVLPSGYAILIFYIIVIPTVLSYFMMAPTLVVSADQKNYKVNTILKVLAIVRGLLQLGFLYLRLDYIMLVLVDGAVIFLQYFFSRRMAFREYPYLKEAKGLKPDMSALSNTKHVFIHNISSVVKNSSRSIVMMITFPGAVGLVMSSINGSYNYIISNFSTLLGGILNAPKESFGNLLVTEKERVYNVFREYLSVAYFLASMICIVTFVTIGDFVLLWIRDPQYSQGLFVCFCFAYILFEAMVRIPIHNIRNAAGLFKESRWFAMSEAGLNLIFSFILIHQYQLAGLLFATVISSIISGFYLNPNLIYRRVFDLSVLHFYKDIALKLIHIVFCAVGAIGLWQWVLLPYVSSLFTWFIAAGALFIAVALITVGYYFLLVPEFKEFVKRFGKKMLNRNHVVSTN